MDFSKLKLDYKVGFLFQIFLVSTFSFPVDVSLILCGKPLRSFNSISQFKKISFSPYRTDIEELFKSLTKTETVDCMKLAEFMNDKQRDGRLNEITYPKYGKKRILEIINKFEPSEEVKKQESLRLEFTFLLKYYNLYGLHFRM